MKLFSCRNAGLAFLAGVVLTLTLAGPLIGAVWGYFSILQHASGGNTVRAAAHRIYRAIMLRRYMEVDLPLPIFEPVPEGCELAQISKEVRTDGILQQTLSDLNFRVEHFRRERNEGIEASASERAISRLPRPVLGALEGCVNASVLAPICEDYVMRIARTAPLDDDLRQITTSWDRGTARIWCLLAGDTLAAQKQRNLEPAYGDKDRKP